MNVHFLLYIVLFMVFYDFSIHLIYFFGKEEWFKENKLQYWPSWTGHTYQTFWSIYWGSALLFLLFYMFTK